MQSRINIFKQITNFYSIAWHGEDKFTPQHISLYVFLINQNNRNSWAEWFKVPIDLGMKGSFIGSKKTYYSAMEDLKNWGLILYEKGINEWRAPKISIIPLLNNEKQIPLMEVVEVQNNTAINTSMRTSICTATDTATGSLPIPLQHRDKDYKTIRPKTTIQKTYSSEFLEFYSAYPRKTKRDKAAKAFEQAIKKTTLGVILKAIEDFKKTKDWQKDGGVWIPYPATWLNDERWTDSIEIEDTQSWEYLNRELLKESNNGQDHIAIGRDSQSL